jgi:large subunit ribosomal protein L24
MMRIRKGDEVAVIAGKNKGKHGKVKELIPETDRVVIEGVNMIKRHTKRGMARQAGIVEREAPIAASNVMPLCGKCGKPARVGIRELGDGAKARYCKACGEIIEKK